jgi:uncharacterized membrane protein
MSSKPNADLSAGGALVAGWRAMVAHPGVTAFAVALYAAAFVPLHFIGDSVGGGAPSMDTSQAALVKLVLYQMGALLAVSAIVGPLFGALAVFVGKRTSEDDPGTLYEGFNFSLARYARIFWWYLVVQLSVQIGLQLIVLPGILFFQMYAFVVPVLCMEREQWPLARSKRLTTGKRRTIFLLLLPWLVIYVGFGLLDLLGTLQSWVVAITHQEHPTDLAMGVTWLLAEGLRSFYEFWMTAALYFLYEARIRRIEELRAARAGEGAVS